MSGIEEKLNTAVFAWLPLEEGKSALGINIPKTIEAFFQLNKIKTTFVYDIDGLNDQYDYIFAFDVLERAKKPGEYLKQLMSLLNSDGIMYLGTDNRLGLRYFCGDVEPGTQTAFSAIENYNGIDTVNELKVRLYAKNEIENFLDEAGCTNRKMYSVLPNLKAAQLIYAEGYLPHERLATRYMPMYREPSAVFIREEWIYDSIIANGMFHQMANSYFIEIRKTGECSQVQHVTLSADRGDENACATIIFPDRVEKHALFPKGKKRLSSIKDNDDDLRDHHVHVVDSRMESGVYVMPRIEAVILERYLQRLLLNDKDKFVETFDRYRDVIYHSSDIVGEDERGPILKRCYLDMVPLNCFYLNDEFWFYDQEFFLENEAANLILWRALIIVYDDNPTMNAIIPITEMMDRYGITPYAEEYRQISGEFFGGIRNQAKLAGFNSRNLRDVCKIAENRKKIEENISIWKIRKEEWKETCFDELENKEIFIWGSGRYADQFVSEYYKDYKIEGVIDNNAEKQGTEFYGYRILSPVILSDREPDKYKVIVCIKNCESVLRQLLQLGAKNIGVYDINYQGIFESKYNY